MKHLKQLTACFLMAILCIGQVWADPTTIASWGKVSIAANTAIIASDGDANNKNVAQFTSTKAMTTAGTNCYYGSSAGGAVITFSNLNLSGYSGITMAFYARASQQGTMQIAYSTDGKNYTNLNAPSITKSEAQKTSDEIPNTAKYIKLSHDKSSGSLYFGTVVISGTAGGESKPTLSADQLSWSAESAIVTIGANDNTYPKLKNSIPVTVAYSSSNTAVATINTSGNITLVKAGTTTVSAEFAGDDTYAATTVSYKLTVNPASIEGSVVDELTISTFEINTNNYTYFYDKQATNTGHSNAVYAGTVARNGNSSQYNIQLNSGQTNNKLREIVSTTSGGKVKRIQAIWATKTDNTANRTLTVYGSNVDFQYGGSETTTYGDKLGDIVYSIGDAFAYLDIDADYKLIQIVANGAIYMDQINITWIPAATYAVNITEPTGGTLEVKKGTTSIASGDKFEEGKKLTVTATPDGSHTGGTIVVKNASTNAVITNDVLSGTTLTIPAHDIIISATFDAKPCSKLSTPSVTKSNVTYNGVTLSWAAITNAAKYEVKIGENTYETTELSYTTDQLEPEMQYSYQVKALAAENQSDYCESDYSATANFTTQALPKAQLYLVQLKDADPIDGDKHDLGVEFDLPTEAASCSKDLVGWTTAANKDYENETTAPTPLYKKYTFGSEDAVTLYAVYADANKTISTTDIKYSGGTTTNMTGNNDATTLGVTAQGWSIVGSKGGGTNFPGLNKDGTIRLYYNANGSSYITITAPEAISTIAVTCIEGNDQFVVKVGGSAVTASAGVYSINAKSFVIENGYTESKQVQIQNIAVNIVSYGIPTNYSTTCVDAPEVIVAPEEINVSVEGVENGIIEATYDHVNKSAVSVAIYNNVSCTEVFTGEWLTASLNSDKNIAYSITANSSYANTRKAFIKITAPETNGAASPAELVIPVTQAKKEAVFTSLEDLAASDLTSNSKITISFSDVLINEIYFYNNKRRGLNLNVQREGSDIRIYFNADVPAEWVAGGKVSGSLKDATWSIYGGAWQIQPANGFNWTDDEIITYTAPAAVSSIEIRGAASKKTYVDGEVFSHDGLTVMAIYSDSQEDDVTSLATWLYDPETLSEGDTEVEVTATYNNKTDSKQITGLTVTAIPDKTIAEFIAAEGTRCYLEGTVSDIEMNGTSQKKEGRFNLTDASGTIYIYNCLNADGETNKFDLLGIDNGDRIKVIAEEYTNYQGTKEAKNVQFVSKVSKATITIADKQLEEGASWTIVATTNPESAVDNISYSIKDGSDDCITLSGNVITATAIGEAIIIASVPEGTGYMANSVEFTVTVVEAGSVKDVVILAQYDGIWYALMNEQGSASSSLNAMEVDYSENIGVIWGLTAADQAKITWERSISAGGTTASFKNDSKYINGGTSKTDLTLSDTESLWTIDGEHYLKGSRTFIYYKDGYFKNYSTTNVGDASHSDYPKVVADIEFLTRSEIRSGLYDGKWGTFCSAKDVKYPTGAVFFTFNYVEMQDNIPYKVFFDEIGENESLQAGKPYVYIANSDAIHGVLVGDAVSQGINDNGFIGCLSDFPFYVDENDPATQNKYYVVYNDQIMRCTKGYFKLLAGNAYLDAKNSNLNVQEDSAPAPGRRRVTLTNPEAAPQVATGLDAMINEGNVTKVIINQQLFILRDGKLYDITGRLVSER